MNDARKSGQALSNDASASREVSDSNALDGHKRSMVTRLRRVEGQLRGVQNMIEQNAGCEAVAQQIAAARRALDRAFYEMVACAMEAELDGAEDLITAKAAGALMARILAKYG